MNLEKTNSSKLRAYDSQTSYLSRAFLHVFLVLHLFMMLISCDHSFDPIKENVSTPVSMYGYLDASADTQWVRVTPLRYQIGQALEKPDMDIEIQHLRSGDSTVMTDSLFQLRQGFNVINAWSTLDIEPGETYKLEATRPDGAASRVTVEIPEAFPVPTIGSAIPGCLGLLRIKGVPQLVDVQSRWKVRIYFLNQTNEIIRVDKLSASISYRNQARRIAEGAYEVFIETSNELGSLFLGLANTRFGVVVDSRELYVARGGPDWNEEIRGLDDIEYALSGKISNVENGLGYVLGITSRSISYLPTKECLTPFDPNKY